MLLLFDIFVRICIHGPSPQVPDLCLHKLVAMTDGDIYQGPHRDKRHTEVTNDTMRTNLDPSTPHNLL